MFAIYNMYLTHYKAYAKDQERICHFDTRCLRPTTWGVILNPRSMGGIQKDDWVDIRQPETGKSCPDRRINIARREEM